MSLIEKINEDIKSAMRAGETTKRDTLRLVISEVKRLKIDAGTANEIADDAFMTSVLNKMVKQRDESIAQFTQGNRLDLVDIEEAEKSILQAYLPEQLTHEELSVYIDKAIDTHGAKTMQDMGKVMQTLKTELTGRGDLGWVSQQVKNKLS